MSSRGGKRVGAGRKPGASNKRTREAIALAEASGRLPLDVMLEAMNRAYIEGGPVAAHPYAKDAAPFCHARLAATEVTGKDGDPVSLVHRIERVIVDAQD